MVSVKKIPRRTTRNSSRSNAVARSPPRSPLVAVDSSPDASHAFSMANLTDLTQSPLYMNNSDHPEDE
ncbi:hypothetical protein N665_0015s0059 [Sinapis alba]|nr:hypothetical protein N665_0015s0059 [Sinapis alba]